MMAWIIVAAVLTLAVFLGGFGRIARLSRRGQEITALSIFVLAIISLTSIYYYCYVQSATGILDYFSAFLRSLFGAIAAVVNVSNDYAAIAPILNANPVLTLIYWVAIMLATSAFVLAIAAIFGRRLIDSLRWRISFGATRYLIVGCNEESLALGMNIASHDHKLAGGKADGKRVIRYLACPGDALDLEAMLARTQDFGAMVAEYSPLTLTRDLRILRKRRSGRDGLRRNHLIIALPRYSDALQALERIGDCTTAEASNRHRLATYVISDSATVAKAVAYLAREMDIRCLSQDELLIRGCMDAYPPYRLLDVSRDKPTKDFGVALCGFGGFNQRFLDHLIQNGQFLGSRMKALLIDPDIEARIARYRHRRPALDLCIELTAEDANLRSVRLLNILRQELDKLDLILVNTADFGIDASESRDFVEDIADLVSIASTAATVPTQSLASQAGKPLLIVKDESGLTVFEGNQRCVFAYGSEVFSEANLINSALDRQARLVNYIYSCAPDDDSKAPALARMPFPSATAIDRQWEEVRDAFTQDSNRATAAFLPALAALAGKPPTYADLENPVSASPDLLLRLAENEHLRWMAFHVVKGWQPLSLEDMEKECARVAKAADGSRAAIRGFQKTAQRQHACLAPFAEIDAVSQRYNELLKQQGSTAPKRDFAHEDTKIIRYLEWINSCSELYGF